MQVCELLRRRRTTSTSLRRQLLPRQSASRWSLMTPEVASLRHKKAVSRIDELGPDTTFPPRLVG